MQPSLRRQHEVVQKALEFMRHRLETRTTMADIARHVSYSPSHLRLIFRTVTGKGVLPNLNAVRIEKAKNLLRQTSLNVGEVAAAVGCKNHSSFTRLFCRAIGTSPAMFRKTMGAAGETPAATSPGTRAAKAGLVVHDDFATGRLAGWWTPTAGDWRPQDGHLQGSSTEVLCLRLSSPLPENFRMAFDVRVPQPTNLSLSLQEADGGAPYCEVSLPPPDGSPGALRIRYRHVLSNPEAVIEPGPWRAVQLELNDNRIAIALDGKRVFSFRDIFPPSYSSRSQFALSSYGKTIEIRRFRLLDLGFLAVAPAIRQGDAFFNMGLFKQASEFYLHHLLPNLPPDEEMELRFKIGMCLFRQGQIKQCRGWMHSLKPLAKEPFWRRECELVLLQLEADTGRFKDFERHATELFRDPLLRDGIRPLIGQYFSVLRAAGFHDRALSLATLSFTLEEERSGMAARARDRMVNILKNRKRFAAAKRHLTVLSRPPHADDIRRDAFLSLSEIGILQNRIADARRIIARGRELAMSQPESAWSDFHEAICLRAERRFPEAVALFLSIRARHPASRSWHHTAETGAAELLCRLGEVKEASALIARIRKEVPETPFPYGELFRGYVRVSHLVEKRYEELAALLLPEARRHDDQLARHGQDMVTAGILLELAGKPEQARKVWGEAGRRFPPERCYFWGTLAKNLAAGKPDHLGSMKLFFRVRSELFYLAGLLYEHRGDASRARRLFALSVKEDPTLCWPAQLASTRQEAPRVLTPAGADKVTRATC